MWLAIPRGDGVIGAIATTVGIALAPSPIDGLAIARERIAKEAEEKTGFLDRGMLGLTEPAGGTVPAETFAAAESRGPVS
jgi:hypothetical protein